MLLWQFHGGLMKIQIVSDFGPPVLGGAETYVINLGMEFIRMGHEAYWNHMRLANTKSHEKIEGIDCHRSWVPFAETNAGFARLLYSIFMFPKVLKTSKKSNVVQFNSFVAATTGWLAGKISRKPYVLMVHEFFRDLWKSVGRNFLERNFYPQVEEFISKSPYPQVICPSNYTKKILTSLGVEDRIINVIYHGVDHSLFHTGYEPTFKKGFENKYLIGWSGRIGLSVTKNLKTLFEAFTIVKNQIPESLLVFKGSNFSYLVPTIKKLGLELNKEVIYGGGSSTDDLPYFYSSCDILAMPSLSEGFGFSAVEAQACGTPVICFERGSLPEVVKNGETGIIVEDTTAESLAEGIIKVLSDNELRYKLKQNAPRWAQSFRWNDSANKHLEVYKKCQNNI